MAKDEYKFKKKKIEEISGACGRYKVTPEFLAAVKNEIDSDPKLKEQGGFAYSREEVLNMLEYPEATEKTSTVAACVNRKIKSDPRLRKYGIKIGYQDKGKNIKFKVVDWETTDTDPDADDKE